MSNPSMESSHKLMVFGHHDKQTEAEFIQIFFASGNHSDTSRSVPLEVTSYHLVFVERHGHHYPVAGTDVVIGYKLSDKTVESIATATRRGLYAPLTQSGDFLL
jgi:hypothetical protein